MKQFSRRRFLLRSQQPPPSPTVSIADVAKDFNATSAQQETPVRVGKDALKAAEAIAGLRFTDPEEDMAIAGLNRNLESYEALRAIDIPLDTEPPLTFRPNPPGKQPRGRATRNAPLAIASKTTHVRVTSRLDELAFEPVTVLSSLIKSRRITASALTKMYPRPPRALRRAAALRRDPHQGSRTRGGRKGGPGTEKGPIPRAAARHSMGCERSLRHQGHPDDLGREAI